MYQDNEIVYVHYKFHRDNLFNDSDDYIRYDANASAQKYVALCQTKLKQEYPNAEIEILSNTTGKTEVLRREQRGEDVYGIPDPYEADIVETMCSMIHEDFEWVAPRVWLTAEEAYGLTDIPISVIRWACISELIEGVEKVPGRWRFPVDTYIEFKERGEFANYREGSVLSISMTDDSIYEFVCLLEDVLHTDSFPPETDTLLVISNCFWLTLFGGGDGYLLISRCTSKLILAFEHFLSEAPWPGKWSYEVFIKAMVVQTELYDFVKGKCRECEHSGKTFSDGASFEFIYDSASSYILHDFVKQSVNTLKDMVQNTQISLAGGPIWKVEYERDEKLFCEDVLAPLLRRMGFEKVQYTHGRDEFGKDFIFSQRMEFGELCYGLQAKAGNVGGGVNSKIDQLLGQIKDAFEMPYQEIGLNNNKYIAVLIIAISGRFTENARRKIKHKMPEYLAGSVYFWDKERILSLIINCWTNRR